MDFSAVPAALVRAVGIGAALLAAGTLLLLVLGLAAGPAPLRLARAALGVAAVALAVWFLMVTHALIGGGLEAALDGAPLVATTLFGRTLLLQLVLLAACGLALAWRGPGVATPARALPPAALAVALQAGHLHGVAMEGVRPSLLLASEVLHLLGAAAWIGALPVLLLVLLRAPLGVARSAARRFGWVGAAGVALMATTASVQAVVLLGGVEGALGTAYGRLALAKIALFGLLLALAARHRFVLLPRLYGLAPVAAQAALARSVALELGVGAAAVVAAGLLSTAPPGMHM